MLGFFYGSNYVYGFGQLLLVPSRHAAYMRDYMCCFFNFSNFICGSSHLQAMDKHANQNGRRADDRRMMMLHKDELQQFEVCAVSVFGITPR